MLEAASESLTKRGSLVYLDRADQSHSNVLPIAV
jgi:hypothetical protein